MERKNKGANTPTAAQVATAIFANTRYQGKRSEKNKWMQKVTGLTTLWINRIIKKGWGWHVDPMWQSKTHTPPLLIEIYKYALRLNSLEYTNELEQHDTWFDL